MNLRERLQQIKQSSPEAVPSAEAIPEQMSRAKISALREDAVRRHMIAEGATAEEAAEYIRQSREGNDLQSVGCRLYSIEICFDIN